MGFPTVSFRNCIFNSFFLKESKFAYKNNFKMLKQKEVTYWQTFLNADALVYLKTISRKGYSLNFKGLTSSMNKKNPRMLVLRSVVNKSTC